eukprot:scaffold7641_cov115-Cylindrotheca_fusiformis.AAC.18
MKGLRELNLFSLTFSSFSHAISSSSGRRVCNKVMIIAKPASGAGRASIATRRQWMQSVGLVGGLCLSNAATTKAACLPGDLSKECIGVYKVPMDANVLPYVGTPEDLKKFAPDLKYVPPIQAPDNFSAALDDLKSQRIAADDIQQVVSAGRLEEAGIKVLNLMPKVTSAGRLVVDVIEGKLDPNTSKVDEMKLTRIRDQLDMVIGLWGECDVTIGQGLRGQMGVSAVAQLQVLSSLREATGALDDFLASVNSLCKDNACS